MSKGGFLKRNRDIMISLKRRHVNYQQDQNNPFIRQATTFKETTQSKGQTCGKRRNFPAKYSLCLNSVVSDLQKLSQDCNFKGKQQSHCSVVKPLTPVK